MSAEDSGLTDVPEGESWEEALHKLLKEQGLNLHTEILHPDAQSNIDYAGEHWGRTISPGVGKLIAGRTLWYRRNMAAKDRKRALEIIDGIKGQVENEKKKLDLEATMLGRDR